MLEVTCFHCGQVVQISPDAERCSVCGMNLRKFIGREQASGYFYDRAATMAGANNVLGGFQEVQRGLSYVTTSELNLLGAILCKRLGRLEEMRHYVAAIPVDDPLRGEGEWLLRSNQARQRAVPEVKKGDKAPISIPVIPDRDALPTVLDEVTPSQNHPKGVKKGNALQPVLWLALFAILAVGGWYFWQNPPEGLLTAQPGAAVDSSAAPPGSSGPDLGADTPTPSPTSAGLPAAGVTPPADGALTLPTPTIAPDLALGTSTAEAIVAVGDQPAVDATDLTKLDWPAFLRQRGRADLVDLPVTVRAVGSTLVFEGVVELAEERATIGFEAKQVPGVAEVSVVNVKLRLPATYTVRPGDSLWAISVRIYGNAEQIEELYAANQDQMASANALTVGMVLKVPPVE